MDVSGPTDPSQAAAGAAERGRVEEVCAEARRLRAEARVAAEALRDARRELSRAHQAVDAAGPDVDHHRIAGRKATAQKAYRAAMTAASDEAARRSAAATWLSAIDAINRRTRAATRELAAGHERLIALEARASKAELEAAAARIRAEAAEEACVEARLRVAADDDERNGQGPDDAPSAVPGAVTAAPVGDGGGLDGGPDDDVPGVDDAGIDEPGVDAASGDPPVASASGATGTAPTPGEGEDEVAEVAPPPDPTVLQRLLDGDAETQETLARELGEMTGTVPARFLLLLHELAEDLSATAVEAGSLDFDHDHPFWSQFSPGEARLIGRALRAHGFRLDVSEGWYGGRAPAPSDLAAALAYAGFDVRGLRRLLSADELRELPQGVAVATYEHVAREAPELTLDQVVALLGSRAGRLDDLWDEWGRLRPMLLEVRSGDVAPGVGDGDREPVA